MTNIRESSCQLENCFCHQFIEAQNCHCSYRHGCVGIDLIEEKIPFRSTYKSYDVSDYHHLDNPPKTGDEFKIAGLCNGYKDGNIVFDGSVWIHGSRKTCNIAT